MNVKNARMAQVAESRTTPGRDATHTARTTETTHVKPIKTLVRISPMDMVDFRLVIDPTTVEGLAMRIEHIAALHVGAETSGDLCEVLGMRDECRRLERQ